MTSAAKKRDRERTAERRRADGGSLTSAPVPVRKCVAAPVMDCVNTSPGASRNLLHRIGWLAALSAHGEPEITASQDKSREAGANHRCRHRKTGPAPGIWR